MFIELGRSQVEVQQCPLRTEGSWPRAWRKVGKAEMDMEMAEVDLEMDTEVVEEKEEKKGKGK